MISKSAIEFLFEPQPDEWRRLGSGFAHIRKPYSPKNFRRLHCETDFVFALCVQLECDPRCARYNEAPAPVPHMTTNGDELTIKVKLISQSTDGKVTFYRASEERLLDECTCTASNAINDTSDLFTRWATEQGCLVCRTSLSQLRSNEILFDSQRQLWRWISVAHGRAPVALEQQILELIRSNRSSTLQDVLDTFRKTEECVVLRAAAQIMVAGHVRSDIAEHPLSYATELTVFDDERAQ